MIYRHPHVFKNKKFKNIKEFKLWWDNSKDKDLNSETDIKTFIITLMPNGTVDEVINDNKQVQSFQWNNLERNKDYTFEIKSIGEYSASESISSNLFKLRDKPKPPKNIYIQNLGDKIELIWSAPIDDNGVILDIDSFQIRNKDHEILSTVDANEENFTTISKNLPKYFEK